MNLFAVRDKPLTSPLAAGLIIVGALLIALVVGAILMLLIGADPLAGYRELLYGMFGSSYYIAEALTKATPLLIIGLGLAISFRASIWNIGAEGQFYVGAVGATALALALHDLHPARHSSLPSLQARSLGSCSQSFA